MGLENIIQSEIKQSQEDKYYVIPRIFKRYLEQANS